MAGKIGEKLGNRINTLRVRADLSQKEFAARLDIAPEMISRWEAGKVVPSVVKLVQIANALDTKIEDLFAVDVARKKYNERRHVALQKINYLLRSRPTTDIEAIVEIVRRVFEIKRRSTRRVPKS